MPEEGAEPKPPGRVAVAMKIRVRRGARRPVMGEMRCHEIVVPKAGIKQERDPPDRPVELWAEGRQRAVHGIMRDDEQPHREPALQGDEDRRQSQDDGPRGKEYIGHMQDEPAEQDGGRKAEADRRLPRHAARAYTGRGWVGDPVGPLEGSHGNNRFVSLVAIVLRKVAK
jgi:hypothetical protein